MQRASRAARRRGIRGQRRQRCGLVSRWQAPALEQAQAVRPGGGRRNGAPTGDPRRARVGARDRRGATALRNYLLPRSKPCATPRRRTRVDAAQGPAALARSSRSCRSFTGRAAVIIVATSLALMRPIAIAGRRRAGRIGWLANFRRAGVARTCGSSPRRERVHWMPGLGSRGLSARRPQRHDRSAQGLLRA